MPLPYAVALFVVTAALAALIAYLVYLYKKYTPTIVRIFQEPPIFWPMRVAARTEFEEVRFQTADGLSLAGAYMPATAGPRVGVVVYCHEYLGNRWNVVPYAESLRGFGFDLFSFDFRNHGTSETEACYQPLQWLSDREVEDLRAALRYLKSRPDADPAGVGLFGVSKGGSAALFVAAEDPTAWGVITDGSFPTRGMIMSYMRRWAEIYSRWTARLAPACIFSYLALTARVQTERQRGCRYPDIERAARRLSPRPWLMIHGQKDSYVTEPIARTLHDLAGRPKDLWIVPGAKHNGCLAAAPDAYRTRLADFFAHYAPRRPVPLAPIGGEIGSGNLFGDLSTPAPLPARSSIEPAPMANS